jgi:hypothetical protein
MAGLESLSNPLERLPVLNGAGSLSGYVKTNPLTNSADWDVDQQYFLGDSCRSPLDGFTYVYTGGDLPALPSPPPNEATGPITSIRGGVDPSLDSVQDVAGGYWLRNAPLSSAVGAGLAPTVVSGATWTVTGGVLALPLASNAKYLAVVQGVLNLAAGFAATDHCVITLTPNGVAPVPVLATLVPGTGTTAFHFSASLVFDSDLTVLPLHTVTLSGASVGTAPTTVTNVKMNVIRLS